MSLFKYLLPVILLGIAGCEEYIHPALKKLGMRAVPVSPQKLLLLSPDHRIALTDNSAVAIINGIPVQLEKKVSLSGDHSAWTLLENSIHNILIPILSPEPYHVRTVIIDPGHGGHDSGAVSAAGIKEKTLNLELAQEISRQLRQAGFNAILSRDSDKFISLSQRAEMSKKVQADLFISIHHNSSATNPRAAGMETFALRAKTPEESRLSRIAVRLAYLIQKEQYGISQSPGRGVKFARFKVLRDNSVPAVLVEAGFLSNPQEAHRCADPEHRLKLALAVTRAVSTFAGNDQRSR